MCFEERAMAERDKRDNTQGQNKGPQVPVERPDREAAARDPGPGAKDRPGFDLGGAVGESNPAGSNIIPGGPKGTAASGATAGARATGVTDPSDSRSLGNEGDAGSATGAGPTDGSGSAS
jgi:hypothetical protein